MEFAIEDLASALSDDPACADLLRQDVALLLWDRSGERLIWSSPSADESREAFAVDHAGRPDPTRPASERLRALGQQLTPQRGLRLERIWFDPDRIAPPATYACRIVTLQSGQELLLTALMGHEPRTGSSIQDARFFPSPGLAARGREIPTHDAPAHLGRGTVRFTWRADPATRFTDVSASLGEVVGRKPAMIVGLTWSEIARRFAADPTCAVTELFARRETWSGRPVHWRVGDGEHAVAVELAGMPVFSREGTLIGFRGFGLCRTDTVVPWVGEPDRDAPAPADDPVGDAPRVAGSEEDIGASPDQAETGDPAIEEIIMNDAAETVGTETEPLVAIGAAAAYAEPLAGLHGTVAARLGSQRHAPLRAVDASFSHNPALAPSGERQTTESWPRLSMTERNAFREIARALGARYAGDDPTEPAERTGRSAEVVPVRQSLGPSPDPIHILERMPVGILVHRGEQPLFANRLLLDWIGYAETEALAADGGVGRLFQGCVDDAGQPEGLKLLTLSTCCGSVPVDARLTTIDWGDGPAGLMLIRKLPEDNPAQRAQALELELKASEARVRELSAILDAATDGVAVLDDAGRILALNRSAEALFGYDQSEVAGEPFTALFAFESHATAVECLNGLRESGTADQPKQGREVLGRVRQGGVAPLFMTISKVSEGPERKFCCVLRDITPSKQAESDLRSAKDAAEAFSAQRSDLLARINHDIRTPLNAIIGFTEVMLDERFGVIGSERYKEYLKDVHDSGRGIVRLVDDLLDLAKAEAGQLELSFANINLNALAAGCIAQLQPQAARERILVRTSYALKQPSILADERSVRQAVLNILSNAVRFTDAGGQVIVSTAVTDRGLVALRVRDTGIGMTGAEIDAALKPFRQVATSRRDGAGLGLPLAKALVAANRGALQITSAPNEGTLVEILFPPMRPRAEETPSAERSE